MYFPATRLGLASSCRPRKSAQMAVVLVLASAFLLSCSQSAHNSTSQSSSATLPSATPSSSGPVQTPTNSPVSSPAISPTASPVISPVTPSASPATSLAGPYGILISSGMLELVNPDASIAASVPIAPQLVLFCQSGDGVSADAPQVSATSDRVYFKDGGTQIRRLVPPSGVADVTTVPGGPSTVSFFSVSPDDQRIAVVVEDFPVQYTPAPTVSIRLYVEDLQGGGHHSDIYSTTTPYSTSGITLWPMGWHQGALVLAVMPVCSLDPEHAIPLEYHVSSASTGDRIATIKPLVNLGCGYNATSCNCTLSVVPARIGVSCLLHNNGSNRVGEGDIYDWSGNRIALIGALPSGPGDFTHSALSPSGNSILFTAAPPVWSEMEEWNRLPTVTRFTEIHNYAACLWIDEQHVLAPDAVILFPASVSFNGSDTTATQLKNPGTCVGRFPGGL